jgi:hypothetical protein
MAYLHKAGLRDGDIVVGFASENVSGIDELHRLPTADRALKSWPLKVLRGVHLMDLTGTPESRPDLG